MGDIGALALGAALGVVAVIVRQEIVLAVMGGIFVLETVSVILQVGSFKLRGKRIFRMAPDPSPLSNSRAGPSRKSSSGSGSSRSCWSCSGWPR